MRLDTFLFEKGFCDSRNKAKNLIDAQRVCVNGKIIEKASFDVNDTDKIEILKGENFDYVGRGGLKLEKALTEFSINPDGLICADIGASTGGFTECLLIGGAKKVYAIDSGTNQLARKLLEDKRVICLEGTNARYLTCDSLPEKVDLVVMDVSFISQTLIYNAIINISKPDSHIITLFKPQFEVGKSNIGKNGIVKSDKARKNALDSVLLSAKECGFEFISFCESPIKGGDGNIEYLLHFIRK